MQIPAHPSFKNLTEMSFGRLTVLKYAGKVRKSGRSYKQFWLCECACGNKVTVEGSAQKTGKTQSCSCLHAEFAQGQLVNLADKTFGNLIVLWYEGFFKEYKCCKKKIHRWICKCKCGKELSVAGDTLRNGNSTSCGSTFCRFVRQEGDKLSYRKRFLSDPIRRMRHSASVLVARTLKANGGSKNGGRTFSKLPYTPQQLKEHLESQFEPWMNWGNYGGKNDAIEKTWHIDHIKPQASFSFISMDDQQFLECWALSNLRPLEKIENIKKGKR